MFVRGRYDLIGWDAIQLLSDAASFFVALFFSLFEFTGEPTREAVGTWKGVSGRIRRGETEKGGPACRRMRRYRELEGLKGQD